VTKKPASLRLKINHIVVSVLPLAGKRNDGDTLGYWSAKEQAIFIHPEYSPAEQVRILWHEIVHAFYWAYNVDDVPRTEEAICDLMESPLAALFRDNPHLGQVLNDAFAGKPLVR